MREPPGNRPNRKEIRAAPALDAAALERLALRYVERFATTRGRLAAYLSRKIRERGWDGGGNGQGDGEGADPAALAEKLAELGYIDDRAFGEARAAAMGRRGLGKRRVTGALRQAGIDEADSAAIVPAVEDRALETALAFARRRRIGPFALVQAERPEREKQIAAMVRGGHDFGLARRIAAMAPGEAVDSIE